MPVFLFTDEHVEEVTGGRKNPDGDENGLISIPDFLSEKYEKKSKEEKEIILMGWNIWYFLSQALKAKLSKCERAIRKKSHGKKPIPAQAPNQAKFSLSFKKGELILKIFDPNSAALLNMPQEIKIKGDTPDQAYCKFMSQYRHLL
jgi:hypothetical protein